MPRPEARACPPSGVDTIAVNIEQTYTVEGVGSDTVSLEGSLTLERGAPLVDPQHGKVDWKTSIQVANVKALDVSGKSDVFGPVHIVLDHSVPSFGVITDGKLRSAVLVAVSMPEHDLTLLTEKPLQMHSNVTSVPPVGDEHSQNLQPVALVDAQSRRKRGSLDSAHVHWRDLRSRVTHAGC